MSEHYFARMAVAALIKLAKSTADPKVAVGFIAMAANLKDHVGELPLPAPERTLGAPDAWEEN